MGTDLRVRSETTELFEKIRPKFVIHCAAFVGGISYGYEKPVELFHNNMQMALNVFEASHFFKVKRIVVPVPNCVYPAQEGIHKESNLWEGHLHESVMSYGHARKALCVLSWAYQKQFALDTVNLILSNMYGPGDHFDEHRSHACGALIKKIVQAKFNKEREVILWGSGKPVREWLYIDDGAESMIRGLSAPACPDPINIGLGVGVSIRELAEMIRNIVGYEGKITFDSSQPDGVAYKALDGSQGELLLQWRPKTGLEEGLIKTITWYSRRYPESAKNLTMNNQDPLSAISMSTPSQE
jgi:GDP-L-fucose synthase